MQHPLSSIPFGKAGVTQPAVLAAAMSPERQRLDIDGKTVEQVWSELSSALGRSELEPEWICPANLNDDPDEATSGARFARPWPQRSAWNRIAVSVHIGMSEGWIIHVDWIFCPEQVDSLRRAYAVMPLLRAKVFSSHQAWDLARFIAHALDVA
jgi:hypothetical protein